MAHWVREMGLELHPSQTRSRPTLEVVEGGAGFDCLGVTIRPYPSRARRGDKTIICQVLVENFFTSSLSSLFSGWPEETEPVKNDG
jgi:hypothetical protein